ncbi:DUF2325 domain-containing protein [Methylophilus medardicus]|uniref:DUF2325 domain-containing protein n=1 Tax=Methylophilus medardicus TaxID=2588534 RepID=A0A5B8CU48_9PROT|nr:DUF2325 domain-containing protein [Methylophilus medardicus]QDC44435.1 DUF2325 domain-containing protein [Methylophilus medardicus]QDC49442.1 DUF2325 domain-containing protein [Methylophilus medardicus]QDC53147.1 DUF2325 domain-containing protein [Methylophilus medardicus]
MSKALVIGGDRIEGIKQVLQAQGIDKIDHWTGRKPGDVKRELPANVNVIVLVIGWLNHSMMYRIKHVAHKRGLKVVYTRNSADGMQRVLEAA